MSTFVVIEVCNRDQMIAEHGMEAFKLLESELSIRLQSWVRKRDKMTTDRSGRVQALLTGVSNHGQINLAAKKLERLLTSPFESFGCMVNMILRVGFTLTLGKQDTREAALARASTALERAKRENRLFRIYDVEYQQSNEREIQLVARLEKAVERGEFVLFFQPKVSAAYGNVIGAEALLRWVYEKDNIITPDKFIEVAERHNLILPLTYWVVKSAIARCVGWTGDVGVSVNVPPTVLRDSHLKSVIVDALALYGLDPKRLTVEVTESVMSEDNDSVHKQLSALRELGVQISLDDFGTGYSSLAYFRDLPVDEIKIDKSFVMAMLSSRTDKTIVKTVIDLAQNFDLKVVAEGVENKEIAEALTEMGCQILQGYLFDAPLPADTLERHYQLL